MMELIAQDGDPKELEKITKDFFEKKINSNTRLEFLKEIPSVLNYYKKLGFFNEESLLEITLQNFEKKGYSKKKIRIN